MDVAIIELEDVVKTYQMGENTVTALDDVSVEINAGEFIIIMGPSGSGKSTLMNMIGCLDTPTDGTLRLQGQDVSTLHEDNLARIRGRTIGFIFQKFNLIPSLTAKENVALPLTFQDVPNEEQDRIATKHLEEVGLGDRLDHRPTELSGGQQQRVAIARSLVTDPPIILADEPTGNLDSKTGQTIIDLLQRLNKDENKTIIIVTHDVKMKGLGTRRFDLKDGRIIE